MYVRESPAAAQERSRPYHCKHDRPSLQRRESLAQPSLMSPKTKRRPSNRGHGTYFVMMIILILI